jgi:peptidoglycan/LPS O-acetylase OafA/YrhL
MGIIRVLLALSVLLAHSFVFPITGNVLVGGLIAVQCFYMISGFYMALVLTQRYASRADFYFNRFLRLYPTYWFLLLCSTLAYLVLGKPTFVSVILNSSILHWDGKILMLFANFFIFGSDAMMFLFPSADGLRFTADFSSHQALLYPFHVMWQAWTLPVEMAFYAIAPFVVKSPPRLISIFILSMIVRYFIYSHVSSDDPWTYRFFPCEAAFFCAGAIAFHAYSVLKEFRGTQEIGLILFLGLLIYITNFNRVPVLIADTFLFPGGLIQFYGFAIIALPFVFCLSARNRLDRWLGELSYPIYLSHEFVIQGASHLPHFAHTEVYNVILNTILISAAINILVQTPIEIWFKRPAGKFWQYAFGTNVNPENRRLDLPAIAATQFESESVLSSFFIPAKYLKSKWPMRLDRPMK